MAVRDDFAAGEVLAAADLNDTFASKVDYATPANAQSGTTYTFVLADATRMTTATSSSAKTFTIPPQSSVTWPANSIIRVVNYGAGALTVNGGSGVTVTNTASTLAQYQSAVAIRTGSDAWTLVPFAGGGVGNADFSNTATGTYTDGNSVSWKYVTFTASGTLTITKSGFADVLVVGGGGGFGGGSNRSGGGGAGAVRSQLIEIASGSYTVTIGAGGAAPGFVGATGGVTSLGSLVSSGGGGGGMGNPGSVTCFASDHVSGGGHAGGWFYCGSTTGSRVGMGAGTSATVHQGFTSSITNTSVEYGIGGLSPAPTTPGSGGWGAAGIAGIVVVRVKV